jgi:hypothetical protein
MKYILGFFVTILLLIILVMLLVFGGDDKKSVPNTSKSLASYSNTEAITRLTIDGPINAPESHRASRITVSQNQTTLEQLRGYDGEILETKTYTNTQTSYLSFLRALELAGYTKGNLSESLENDRGYCPLGTRYIFELQEKGRQLQRFWATTCKGPKSYEGNTSLTVRLFKNQVPNYQKVITTFERNQKALETRAVKSSLIL